MAATTTAERPVATPEEVWATLDRVARYHEETAKLQQENERRWKEGIARREAEEAKHRKEEAERETKRRKEEAEREAQRRKEEAERRKEEAEREAKRQAEEAERETKRQAEEARRQEEEAKRQAEDAKRRAEEAERHRKSELELERLLKLFGETDRKIRENDKRVGGLGRSYGKLVEHLVGPGIIKRFGEHGYHFDDIKKQRYKLCDENGNEETEIDLLLENADTVIAVEVKSRPDREGEYLGRHLLRVEIMRAHSKKEGWEGKRILGAIAGAIFDTPVRNATLKAGFFVIEQSGETMQMSIPEGFKPREW